MAMVQEHRVQMVAWEQSGRGKLDPELTLDDARRLALEAGLVFPCGPGEPLPKQANLSALFEHFEVNSFSAFKALFYSTPLCIHPGSVAPKPGRRTSIAADVQLQRRGAETYVGPLSNGQRQGPGLLLALPPAASDACGTASASGAPQRGALLYLGEFRRDRQDGFGVLVSSSGHAFQGCLQEGTLWGPGLTLYAAAGAGSDSGAPQASEEALRERPVRWEGMMNGRPAGRGLLTYAGGRQESGRFEGHSRAGAADVHECQAVAQVARCNAAEARRVAAAALHAAWQSGFWEEARALLDWFDLDLLRMA